MKRIIFLCLLIIGTFLTGCSAPNVTPVDNQETNTEIEEIAPVGEIDLETPAAVEAPDDKSPVDPAAESKLVVRNETVLIRKISPEQVKKDAHWRPAWVTPPMEEKSEDKKSEPPFPSATLVIDEDAVVYDSPAGEVMLTVPANSSFPYDKSKDVETDSGLWRSVVLPEDGAGFIAPWVIVTVRQGGISERYSIQLEAGDILYSYPSIDSEEVMEIGDIIELASNPSQAIVDAEKNLVWNVVYLSDGSVAWKATAIPQDENMCIS
jgi:hypothetical protein